jgi:hypothetical protein
VNGDRRVHSVASGFEDLEAGIGGVVLDGGDHGVRGVNWLHVRLLREERRYDEGENGKRCSDASRCWAQGLLLGRANGAGLFEGLDKHNPPEREEKRR